MLLRSSAHDPPRATNPPVADGTLPRKPSRFLTRRDTEVVVTFNSSSCRILRRYCPQPGQRKFRRKAKAQREYFQVGFSSKIPATQPEAMESISQLQAVGEPALRIIPRH